jgi:UDP-glucose 4-epimerase
MSDSALLLTGASGFLGRFVARAASERGWLIHGVDILAAENAPPMTSYHQLRLPDPQLAELVRNLQPAYCIHCAGRASVPQSIQEPFTDFEAGPMLTAHLLDVLRRHAPKCRLIFLSSAAVYGNPRSLPVDELQVPAPISPYGFHKWQSELLCREFAGVFGLPTATVRIFSAYGPGLRRQVLWDICRQLLVEGRLKLRGTGNETRDFIHARDIALAVLTLVANAPLNGEVYNLASGCETSIQQLARLVAASLGSPAIPSFDGVVPRGDPLRWRADISKIQNLGFVPTTRLEDGIKSYAQWCRAELAAS